MEGGSPKVLAIVAVVALAVSLIAVAVSLRAPAEARDAVGEIRGEIQALSGQLDEVSQRLEELSSALGEVASILKGLEERVAAVEERARTLEEAQGGLSQGLEEVRRSVEDVAESVGEVSERVGELERSLAELGERVEAVEESIASMGFPLEVSDALGRVVVIPEPPEKIVSIAPSITEILFTIGAGDLVVGVDEYSNYPPEVMVKVNAGELEVVGGFSTVSIEKVLSLQPDLVVGVGGVQLRIIYTLSQLGVTALSLESETIGDVFSNILLLGKITQRFPQAQELVGELRRGLQEVYQTTRQASEEPRVLFVVWIDPIFAAGGGSWVSDLISIAGGVNALTDVEDAWPLISWEKIIEANPQVIIFTQNAGGLENADAALEWLSSQPGAANVTAVSEGRVYMLHGELSDALQRPGVRIALAAEALARILHPQLYGLETIPNDVTLEDLNLGGQG